MIKAELVIVPTDTDSNGSNRLESVLTTHSRSLIGSPTPRISSKLNNLPSKGQEVIDFAAKCGLKLLPWQEFCLINALKVKPDGRHASPLVSIVAARQNGKSTIMIALILTRLFLWKEPLQLGSAHVLTTSLETFRHIVSIIDGHEFLKKCKNDTK